MHRENLINNSKPFNKVEERGKVIKELEKRPYLKKDTLIKKALPYLAKFNKKGVIWFRERILILRIWTELIN